MRQHTTLFVSLVAGTVLFASACSDTTQPMPSSDDKVGFDPIQQPDDPVALVRDVHGFGGFFFDRDGAPTVYLRDVSARAQVERALGPWLASQGIGVAGLRVRGADYDWASLERWQGRATTEALAMRGAVWVDADEARNRVTIGVERGTSMAQVRSAVARLGVPSGAVVVEEVEPVRFAATLQSRVRPVVGSLQINFPGFLCTLGFNATRNGQRSFITNSHCTNVQGGVESTPYWQPTQGAPSAQIATEVADPAYTTGGGCRPAAAAAAAMRRARGTRAAPPPRWAGSRAPALRTTARSPSPATSASPGKGARARGRRCTRSGGPPAGHEGRSATPASTSMSTGRTSPSSARPWSRQGSAPGDSGAPVFRRVGTGSNVTLVGILWGGSGSSLYVFSPISNIETELGALTTF